MGKRPSVQLKRYNRCMHFLVDALAAYRITRLLQQDTLPVAADIREVVSDYGGPFAEMYECPWCLGFWVSLGVVLSRRLFPRAWSLVATAFAASAVTGWLRYADYAWQQYERKMI